jgi:hypothetical protein
MTIVIPEIYHDSPPRPDSAESTGAMVDSGYPTLAGRA